MKEREFFGVALSKWPVDELLALPWHMHCHLTAGEKRSIVARAKREGVLTAKKKRSK